MAVPIYQTSTYVQQRLGETGGVRVRPRAEPHPQRPGGEQSRRSKRGLSGHAFASGMAAIACLMTLLKAGDHTVVSRNVYGGTYRYFTRLLERSA